jgi:DNA-binding LacI/PurR family transcriptional regulator
MSWKAIEERLRREIADGVLAPGSRLPSGNEIAAAWGVSRHTAQRALEDLQRQGLIVRQRGLGTVVASTESRARSVALLIDVLIPGANHPSSDLLRGLHDGLGEEISFQFVDGKDDPAVEVRQLHRLRERVDGIVTIPTLKPETLPALAELAADGYPLVLIDRAPPGITVDAVITDNEGASTRAMETLIERGHRRIGFMSFLKPTFSSVQERYEGYRKAMVSLGHDDETIHELTRWFPIASDHVRPVFERLVQDALGSLRSGPEPITALFCVEDSFARSAILACERLGIELPGELEIVTFSNWLPDALGRPWNIHRIAQDHYGIGLAAAQLLLERIEDPRGERRTVRVPAQLFLADAGLDSPPLAPRREQPTEPD